MSKPDLDVVSARLDRAHREIGEIAAQTPAKRWRMSIPAQPNWDSDLIISDALNDGEALVAELRAARDVVEVARNYWDHEAHVIQECTMPICQAVVAYDKVTGESQ